MAATVRTTRLRAAAGALLALALGTGALGIVAPSAGAAPGAADRSPVRLTYHNPLEPRVPGDGVVESCADPTVFHGRGTDRHWYAFCTTDPLNDRRVGGELVFHPVPMLRSTDLVHWRYVGDALPNPPSWAAKGAGFWAPEVTYSTTHHRWYLFYVVTDTAYRISGQGLCDSDSAIGVATASSPTGPWTPSSRPVVAPRRGGDGCNFLWTYDPDVLGNTIGSRAPFYFGSYYGGIVARPLTLTSTGARTDATAQRQITIPNKFEGADVVQRDGWYYLFASAANCCNGPLTGYSVFAGRSRSPYGTYRDREGVSLLAGRAGGTPVLSMNGNRWVGPGHNSVFRDAAGRWWTVYHAVDRFHPYFTGAVGFTKRPLLMDPLDWVGGWPTVRGGRWASDRDMPAPAAQPGERSRYRVHPVRPDRPGRQLARFSDDFSGTTLSRRWTWVRPPADSSWSVRGGSLRLTVQRADLNGDSNNAAVLTRRAPRGNYVVQARVWLGVPAEGAGHNYAQVGVLVYRDDDAFVKLTHTSIWETRQTEWAKEVPAATPAPGYPRYGNSVVGPPGTWTWLRIVKRDRRAGGEDYTAYTSRDGRTWVRGGTWVHHLGDSARIGLVAMGLDHDEAVAARVDSVRVYRLAPRR